MCYGCYEEYGFPEIINDNTKAAAQLIAEVYKSSSVGGNLHIIVDDWNIEDMHIEACRVFVNINSHDIPDPGIKVERECLELLESLTVNERVSALAIHEGYLKLPNKPAFRH